MHPVSGEHGTGMPGGCGTEAGATGSKDKPILHNSLQLRQHVVKI